MMDMKKYLMLLMILTLAGCNSFDSDMPYKPGLMPELPKGSPEFTQGWRDGCQTGLAVGGGDIYKSFYSWKRTPEFEKNDKYLKAWKDGYEYCRQYAGSWDRDPFPTGKFVPSDLEKSDAPLLGHTEDDIEDILSLPSIEAFFGR